MQKEIKKQRDYLLENGIQFSSKFQSGNLSNVTQKDQYTYHLSIQPDPYSTYKTWFYFSIKNIPIGTTITFTIINLSNQVKLFKQGHLPVYRNQQQTKWLRIKIPIQQNGIIKGQEGFQLTFKHLFSIKSKYYFAFSYPWTYSQSNGFIRDIVEENREEYFCNYRALCRSYENNYVNILTVTKLPQKAELDIKQFENWQQFSAYIFPGKKGIFISARVHPGEVASSYILNGFLKYLFSHSPQSELLLQKCIFYIIPIINPDGVISGNFRCNNLGHNLNRFYTNPSKQTQPQIFYVKRFVIQMIRAKLITFCLDLHAHVNKQGSFIYGNSTTIIKDQVLVCLFPKLLQYNCRFFDYQSCNFSQKNMLSKDKGDELSKQGASRVTFFKQTGLATCWTLQCNYNSCKLINQLPKQNQQQPNIKPVSNGIILGNTQPNKIQQQYFLNIKQFQQIGKDIAITILDFYKFKNVNRYTNTSIKNWTNLQLQLAVKALRMIPFRFDNQCRKIINNVNSGQLINDCFARLLEKLELDPLSQYLHPKEIREKQKSIQKKVSGERKVASQKMIKIKNYSMDPKERMSTQNYKKVEVKPNKVVISIPNVPKIPKK